MSGRPNKEQTKQLRELAKRLGEIQKDIANKSIDEIKNYFNNLEGITSVKVTLSPLWKKKAPNDMNKIEITVEY